MEILAVLIAEFVTAIIFPFLLVVGELAVSFFTLIGAAIFGIPARRKSRKPTGAATARPAVSKGILIIAGLSGGLFAIGIAAAVVVNVFFLTPVTAWIAGKISERSQIEIKFTKVNGNLFTGRLSIKGLEVQRRNTDKTEYALTTDTVELNVDVLSLASGQPSFSRLALAGVNGDIWSKAKDPNRIQADDSPSTQLKPRKNFEIRALQISNARIDLHKTGAPSLSLSIDRLTSAKLRSQYVVFDVFFRSNLAGKLNGHDVSISTAGDGTGRETKWRLIDFPAELVAGYVDKAPFNWFERGTIDVIVDDSWSRQDGSEIAMDWRFVLKGVKVVRPTNTNFAGRALFAPVALYINTRKKDLDFKFKLVMNEEQFKFKPSLDAAGLWAAVLNGTARAIADKSDASVGQVKRSLKDSLSKAKDFLNSKRKKPKSDAPRQ